MGDSAVATGTQHATQTLGCFLAALGQTVPRGVVVEPGLRSEVEDRWLAAYEKAGSGELPALREADPELVPEDSARLGAALGRVVDDLPDGGRALVVGHSPTNEAAILGLIGEVVAPLGKGAGVVRVATDDGYEVGAASSALGAGIGRENRSRRRDLAVDEPQGTHRPVVGKEALAAA
jgi:hypothetical protein